MSKSTFKDGLKIGWLAAAGQCRRLGRKMTGPTGAMLVNNADMLESLTANEAFERILSTIVIVEHTDGLGEAQKVATSGLAGR